MALAHSPKIVTNGLVLCLDAADPKSYPGSGTAWTDRSGQDRNATLLNTETSDFDSSDDGGSFTFGGTDEKAEIDHFDYDRTNFTVEAVGKWNVNHTNYQTPFISKWQTSSNTNNEWLLGSKNATGPNTLAALVYSQAGTLVRVETSYNYVVGTIYHMLFTFDSGITKLYINGALEDSTDAGFNEVKTSSSQDFNIAGFYSAYHTQSTIYLARIYNKALTASEVLQNYNTTKSRFGL